MGKNKELSKELNRLLKMKASSEEEEKLTEMEIKIRKPSRMTVIAAALYKKAASGELSAIKEIISALNGEAAESGGVVLIDDIGKP